MTGLAPLTDFRFAKTTLSNGLDVIVRSQPQLPIVAINLWYHVGSKNEERNQRGFTHLFEHLMFEGSEHYPGSFFQHLQRLGANINGSTSTDRTNYFVDVPRAHAELAIAMESDRMAHLLGALTEAKLNIQKDVVKNEYRQNYANRPYGMVWSLLAEALYPPQHPYSWLTIGVMEDIDSATMSDVSSFFRRYYVPGNASLAIVGDIESEPAFALAERYFAPIPGGTQAVPPWVPETRVTESRELVLHDRVELDRLYLIWPTVPHFHKDDAPLVLLADVLGRGKSSRLYRRLVIEEQIAQDVTVNQSGAELAGSFGIIVTLRPERSISQARDLVDAEVRAIAASPVEAPELFRVQNMKTAGFYFALEYIGGFGGVADRLNAYNTFLHDPSRVATDLQRFLAVSALDLQDVAVRYLDGRHRVALSVLGQKPPVGAPVLDRSAAPSKKAPAVFRPPLPQVVTLACGIPLWLISRREVPTLAGVIVAAGGANLQNPGQYGLAQLTLAMLAEGTTSRTSAEIAQAAESMGATISAGCGWDGAWVSWKCLKSDLLASLDLAVDMLLHPTFPEHEWQRVQARARAALRAERDSAEARAYRGFLRTVYAQDHPYRFPLAGTESSVAELTRGGLADFHARFLVPGQSAVVVAGDVEIDFLAHELNRRLSEWSGPAASVPVPAAPALAGQARLLLLDRPGAPQAVVTVGHSGIARTHPAFERVLVLNQLLGGQFTSRLNSKLREERGFTYGVRSHFDCRRGPGPFSIGAALQSNRVADALDDLHHELSALVTSRPPTQAELDDARRALVEGHPRQLETPAAVVGRYAHLLIHGLPPETETGFADRLADISLDSLFATSQEQIHPGALVAVVVADSVSVREELKRIDWARLETLDDS